MLILFILTLGYFLAKRSNFDFFFLLSLFLLGLSIYFKVIHKLITEIKLNILNSGEDPKSLVQRTILVLFYILALFLIQRSHGLPDWFVIYDFEIAGFFILLYIPIILLLKLTSRITAALAFFFLILTALFLVQKNANMAKYLAAEVFLFLLIAFFQSLFFQYKDVKKKI